MPIPSDEDMKRISRTVTYVERLQRSAPLAPSQQQFVAPIVQLIRVTGDPAVSGRYPAVVQDYDADADTWSDLTDADCYAIDPAGTALAAGTYLSRRWGQYNSLPVFTPTEQGLNGVSTIDIAEVDGSPSYTGIATLTVDSADGLTLSQPGAGQARLDIAAATASQAGIASLSDQYLGAGQKAVDEIAIASSAGSVNAADPVLRAFAHTVSASTRYIIAVERDATPYAAQAPLSAIRFIAFCDADRLPDSESDTWIQASGETASEVSQATLSFHVRGAGADNGFVLSADDYASIGTYSTNANFTAFSAGTIMAGLGFVYGDGGTNYPGITSASAVFVAPITVRGGIVTSATSLTDPNADRIAFWDDSAGAIAWLEVGSGLSISGTTISCTATGTVTSITAGTGLSGGTITSTGTIDLANTAVTPGSYTNADITVDAQGRITAASNGSAGSGSPGGSDTHVQFNDGGSFGGEAAFAYDKTTNQLTVPGLTLTEDLLMSAIYDSGSSNLDNYNPTGLSTANTIIYTAGAAIDLTGIAGGATNRVLYFFNNSPYTVTVKYVSGSSSLGNQFVTPDAADYVLPRLSGMMLRWESNYWLIVAGSGGATGGGSYTDEEAQDAVGAMADSNTLAYTDSTPLLSVKTQMSVTSDSSGLKLSGDSGSPGNSKLYGTDGSGTKGWYSQPSGGGTEATQAEMETPTGSTQMVTPRRVQNHPGVAKVAVSFSGTGTPAVEWGYNVSSITDHGVGDYTINFTTSFSDAKISVQGNGEDDAAGGINIGTVSTHTSGRAAGSVRIDVVSPNGSAFVDMPYVFVAVWGDQ